MRKVFLIFLFFQAIFLASQSDLPEVYTVKIEDTGNKVEIKDIQINSIKVFSAKHMKELLGDSPSSVTACTGECVEEEGAKLEGIFGTSKCCKK